MPVSLAIVHLVANEFPAATLGGQVIFGLPISLPRRVWRVAAVIGGLLVTGMLATRPYLLGAAGLALAVLIYTLTFEVLAPFVMVPWGIATVTSVAIVRRLVVVEPLPSGALTLAALEERVPCRCRGARAPSAWSSTWTLVCPAERVFQRSWPTWNFPEIPFVDARTLALAVLAATLGITGWVGWPDRRCLGALGACSIAWLLPRLRSGPHTRSLAGPH